MENIEVKTSPLFYYLGTLSGWS